MSRSFYDKSGVQLLPLHTIIGNIEYVQHKNMCGSGFCWYMLFSSLFNAPGLSVWRRGFKNVCLQTLSWPVIFYQYKARYSNWQCIIIGWITWMTPAVQHWPSFGTPALTILWHWPWRCDPKWPNQGAWCFTNTSC